jgi:hypothetical protein
MKWIHARYILTAFVSILIVLTALTSAIGGVAGITLYMILFFFERYVTGQSATAVDIAAYVSRRYSQWDLLV